MPGEQSRAALGPIGTDPDAFERFYRQHFEAVQRFVARRVDDPYLAADLTADILVAAIESARTYRRRRGDPVAWLFGIARNVVAGERRRNAKNLRATARVRGRELVDEEDLVAELREAGIRAVVQYVPPGEACKQPWPETSSPPWATGDEHAMLTGGVEQTGDHIRFTISNNLPADLTLADGLRTLPKAPSLSARRRAAASSTSSTPALSAHQRPVSRRRTAEPRAAAPRLSC